MKLMVRLIVTAIVVTLLAYLGNGIYRKTKEKKLTVLKTASLPDFNFQGIDSKTYNRKSVSGKPLWLIFFDTGCEYCQMEVENIQKMGELNEVKIWLVSQESIDSIIVFKEKYGLSTLSHIQLLKDANDAAYHIFNVTSPPASFLYSANGALIKSYKGVVKVETVLRDLKQAKFK